MSDARIATKTEPNRLVQWSDDDRSLAFELYFTEAGRSLTTLQSIISTFPYERPIPYRTLYHWRQTDQWDIEADKRLSQIAPNIRQRTAGNLIVAALGMSAYLSQVASGAIEPSKPMLVAAKIALDAAGFSAVGSNKPDIPTSPEVTAAVTHVTSLTREQLIAREQQRRQRRTSDG